MDAQVLYTLDPSRPLHQELGRVAREQLSLVRGCLAEVLASGPGDGSLAGVPIHDARKGLKRLRALVRGMRPAVSAGAYRRVEARLRDAGRLLAASRDALVVHGLFQSWTTQLAPEANQALTPFGQRLAAAGDGAAALIPVAEAERRLADGAAEVERLVPDPLRRRDLLAGVADAYGACRRAMRRAAKKEAEQVFHDWRKSAKVVRHHVELLRPLAPEWLGAVEAMWRDLGDRLGITTIRRRLPPRRARSWPAWNRRRRAPARCWTCWTTSARARRRCAGSRSVLDASFWPKRLERIGGICGSCGDPR